MRLWHYQLIDVLPNKMLVSQWRECIAIKRQWEKGTLKHRLVSYVMNYEKRYFSGYVLQIVGELAERKIKFNKKIYEELIKFSNGFVSGKDYSEHNKKYLKQCYYNLQEKADRGIISKEEWKKIENKLKGVMV